MAEKINSFVVLGVYFGFPPCCIEWFCSTPGGYQFANGIQQLVSKGGLVPCPECARKLFTSEEDASVLIKDRFCSTPFPKEDFI